MVFRLRNELETSKRQHWCASSAAFALQCPPSIVFHLWEVLKTLVPFVLSKLFTRRLKGGIEKQGAVLADVEVGFA